MFVTSSALFSDSWCDFVTRSRNFHLVIRDICVTCRNKKWFAGSVSFLFGLFVKYGVKKEACFATRGLLF